MRTTVEITDDQRVALTALAARRGLRGFSRIVQEAIDMYLDEQSDAVSDDFAALRGSFSDTDADRMEAGVNALRAAPWRNAK